MASYYSLRMGTMYDRYTKETIEIFTIDRRPVGPLATYVEEENTRTACNPCGLSSRGERRRRWAVRLPEAVKSEYPQREATNYVDQASLPGMLTWLAERGYDVIELNWATPLAGDIWLQYTGAGSEFRDAAGARAGPPPQARRQATGQQQQQQIRRPQARRPQHVGSRVRGTRA